MIQPDFTEKKLRSLFRLCLMKCLPYMAERGLKFV